MGDWDALIRQTKVQLQPLPLIQGSELSGIIEEIGAEVSGFKPGDEVYGATNEQLTGAYAEYPVASARMITQKPKTLNFIEAASAPIASLSLSSAQMSGQDKREGRNKCNFCHTSVYFCGLL